LKETLLHFIWHQRLYDPEKLITAEGEPVKVLSPGRPNRDEGPDFLEAKIRIGNMLWAGNVEIHKKASDWFRHGHFHDPLYDSVILHVVAQNDNPVTRSNGETIPVTELSFDPALQDNYEILMNKRSWIACSNYLHRIDPFVIKHWLGRLVIERLEKNTAEIQKELEETGNNWEEVLYRFLARGFGLKVNTRPFYLTARSLPLKYLAKHRDNLMQVEAMLFGQAGLLDTNLFGDKYYEALKKEYHYLQKKFSLTPVAGSCWRQMRMRPSSFPTIRIAEFARFIHQHEHVFSRAMQKPSLTGLESLFNITLDGYWDTHYLFNKSAKKQKKSFGKQAFQTLLINVIIPFYFIYGKITGNDEFREKALDILEKLPAEKNRIIRLWEETGIHADNAFYSQALLQLKNAYCNPGRCLECRIGMKIMTHNLSR